MCSIPRGHWLRKVCFRLVPGLALYMLFASRPLEHETLVADYLGRLVTSRAGLCATFMTFFGGSIQLRIADSGYCVICIRMSRKPGFTITCDIIQLHHCYLVFCWYHLWIV
ncbi:hypothetical protein HD806DRAFT_479753 [Xylariaceae sp. AK1471]|nr:hypothetical protein HD806DRAFT_479753 [Xylariaceae sp. AK1471]